MRLHIKDFAVRVIVRSENFITELGFYKISFSRTCTKLPLKVVIKIF